LLASSASSPIRKWCPMAKTSRTFHSACRDGFVVFGVAGIMTIGANVVLQAAANENSPNHPALPTAATAYGGKQAPIEYEPTTITGAIGITDEQYFAFREAVASIECARYNEMGGAGHRFAGRYQMGKAEIRETADALGEALPSVEAFLNDAPMQRGSSSATPSITTGI
jgi:hypothetical protein